ncbi:hypothetical protein M413DRAFT_446198, partial [Hebeloma cylindrosporum]
MGLSLSTLSQVCLLSAICKATTTCTTTLLPSLEGLGGAFDAPKAKCPPDRGSSDCVTGSQASFLPYHFSDSPSSSPSSSPNSNYSSSSPDSPRSLFNYPIPHTATSPRNIPSRSISSLSTPPLTPDHHSDPSKRSGFFDKSQKKDALDFLMTVFPHHGLSALPYAKSVSISAPNLGADFEGVVLEMPGSLKTLYVDGKSAESVSLRESIVALLDLADESLECTSLIIVLERSSPNLGKILHSL